MVSPDLAKTYSEHLASQAPEDDPEDALIESHTIVAAIGLVPEVKGYLESEAEKLANQWLTDYRVAIKSLKDGRQEVYRQIREMSADPLDVDLAKPKTWLQRPTVILTESKLTCHSTKSICYVTRKDYSLSTSTRGKKRYF